MCQNRSNAHLPASSQVSILSIKRKFAILLTSLELFCGFLMPQIAPSSWAQSVTWSHPYFQLLGLLVFNLLANSKSKLRAKHWCICILLSVLLPALWVDWTPHSKLVLSLLGLLPLFRTPSTACHLLNLVHPSPEFPKAQIPHFYLPNTLFCFTLMYHVLNEFLMYPSPQLTCKWLRTQTTSHSAL